MESSTGRPGTVSLSIRVPESFTAEHQKTEANGVPGAIEAFSMLDVTVEPTSVSFKGVNIIEQAGASTPNAPTHKPNLKPMELNNMNEFEDEMSGKSGGIPRENVPLPQGWTWQCIYKNVDAGEIKTVPQTVTFERTQKPGAPPQYGVKTTVTKFGKSVSRDSLTGAQTYR